MSSHTLVLGGNISGQAAAALLERLGHRVSVYDARPLDPAEFGPRVTFEIGEWRTGLLDDVDLVVTSPGFPPSSPPITATLERGVRLWGEIELAARHLVAPMVAVTGTNGKTTVTEMISAMLQAQGLAAPAVGNIGTPPTQLVGSEVDVLVMEVSSFQLYYTETFHPQVAVLLNLAPDHLDWHGSYERYADAKARVFAQQGPGDVLVVSVDDPGARELAKRAASRLVGVSGRHLPTGGAGPDGEDLVVPTGRISLDDLALDDAVHLVNLAAAATAAAQMGAEHDAIQHVAATFQPGTHRRTLIGTWDNVSWINDSKASNPHAATAAIAAYPSVVLIAGGRNKGLDLSRLATSPHVRHVVAIGEAADEILAGAENVATDRAATMDEAVRLANDAAKPGDTVLLSPGCASFDMFSSYIERGNVFTQQVRAMKEPT